MGESGGSVIGIALVIGLASLLVTYPVLRVAEPWAWIIPLILTFVGIAWGIRRVH
jgi:hypothetical protein